MNTKGHPLLVIATEFRSIINWALIQKAEFIDTILATPKENFGQELKLKNARMSFAMPSYLEQSWHQNLRSTFNQDRFEQCPPEIIFGEVVLMEVNDFISMMYATLVRFYLPVVPLDDLEDLTQDLIEIATSMTIDASLSNWLIKMCRLTLSEEE